MKTNPASHGVSCVTKYVFYKFWKKKWLDEAIKYTSKIATKMPNRNLTKTNNVDFKQKEKNES